MRLQRFRCSLWAQQGSNLRPLGEQRHVYQGDSTPTDHAVRGTGVYPTTHASTPKADHKLTTDLGQRTADAVAVGPLFLPLFVAVLWAYRGDRKAAHR